MTDKKRTITLTDRAPVTIVESEWPRIASAHGDSWSSNDYSRYQQASAQGELDEYHLYVRQHESGRTIVYGVFSGATARTGNESRSDGYLLDAGGDIIAAIKNVAMLLGIERLRIDNECIADLPAEDL